MYVCIIFYLFPKEHISFNFDSTFLLEIAINRFLPLKFIIIIIIIELLYHFHWWKNVIDKNYLWNI